MSRKDWIVPALVLLKFLLPFLLVQPGWEMHRDEYLYYEQGQHLDFGYLENPPVIGLLAFMANVAGGSVFAIKFWPALFGSLTMLVTLKITKEFGGTVYAQIIAAFGILFSAYLRIHYLFQPNFLDIFFWTLGAYYIVRYCKTENEKYLLLLCLALVLGWWSKYSVLFFILSTFLSFLLTKYRSSFLRKDFIMAFLLGCVLIIPNLFWQYMHRFPLIHHMNELRSTQLQYLNRTDFLKEQILMLFPVSFVWIGGLAWLLRHQQFRVIGFIYLIVIVLLMLGSGKGYYALGAYPMLLAAGGVWLERLTFGKNVLRYAFVLFILLLSIPFIPLLLPLQSAGDMANSNKKYGIAKMGLLKWEDHENHALQQDFADMLGWKELANKTEGFFNKLPPSSQNETVVYARNYGLAGGIKYYSKDVSFQNKVISDNGTFLLWIPDSLNFKNLLFIGEEMPDKEDAVFQHFQRVTLIDSCTNPLSRQYGCRIIYFENGSDSALKLALSDILRMKAAFKR